MTYFFLRYSHLEKEPDDKKKALYLLDLQNMNETLFYNILVNNIETIAPLIYTPTVGEVCQQYGFQFRRARGMFFSTKDRGFFSSMVYNWPHDDVRVIVVTDGSRILGLGDLGAHGMGIPIGKLAIYCAAGGIAPHRILPVTIDAGTNNEDLLNDPDYLGVRHRRLEGEEYFKMIDEFVQAAFIRWPNTIIQFEDFENRKANLLLEQYRSKFRVFNDDIQGTGAATLSALMTGSLQVGTNITNMTIVCVGTGSAGIGVCEHLVKGMIHEGMSRDESMSRFTLCSIHGAMGLPDGQYGNPNHSHGISRWLSQWINNDVFDYFM